MFRKKEEKDGLGDKARAGCANDIVNFLSSCHNGGCYAWRIRENLEGKYKDEDVKNALNSLESGRLVEKNGSYYSLAK